jgi:hypothetical protein
VRLQPGVAFGAYTVLDEIGRGGMAVVYEAEHRGLQKRVALKVLHTLAEGAAQRFLREGMASARVHHEHIVDVHDTGVHEGTAYLVMERLQGESLAALLRREGPLDAGRVAELLLPVVSALAAAHDAGVVHRDVKPENIYLSRARRETVVPKLLDFGLARLHALDGEAQRLTGSAALVGTVTHLSPEQVLDPEAVSAASDQYALGVVLYECVTGRLPVQAASVFATLNAVLKGRYPKPRALVPALDPRLDALIVRAMAIAPADRYADVRALGAALLPLARDPVRAVWAREFDAPVAAPDAVADGLVVPMRSAPKRAVPLALVALVGGALALGLWGREPPPATTVTSPAPAARQPPQEASAPPPVAAAVAPAPTAAPAPFAALARPDSPAVAPTRPHPIRRAPAAVVRRPVAPTPSSVAAEPAGQGEGAGAGVPWMLRTQYGPR